MSVLQICQCAPLQLTRLAKAIAWKGLPTLQAVLHMPTLFLCFFVGATTHIKLFWPWGLQGAGRNYICTGPPSQQLVAGRCLARAKVFNDLYPKDHGLATKTPCSFGVDLPAPKPGSTSVHNLHNPPRVGCAGNIEDKSCMCSLLPVWWGLGIIQNQQMKKKKITLRINPPWR